VGQTRLGLRANLPQFALLVGVNALVGEMGRPGAKLLAGIVADAFGLRAAIWTVAALTAASGLIVAVRMYETHPATRAVAAEG